MQHNYFFTSEEHEFLDVIIPFSGKLKRKKIQISKNLCSASYENCSAYEDQHWGRGSLLQLNRCFFFASKIFQNNEDNLKYFPDHLDKYQFIQMVKYDNVYIMMQSLE